MVAMELEEDVVKITWDHDCDDGGRDYEDDYQGEEVVMKVYKAIT